MAIFNNDDHPPEVLAAAEAWRHRCLQADGSVFTDEALWTAANFKTFQDAFSGNLLEGKGTFYGKLEKQLKDVPPEVQRLAAECIWLLLLFVHRRNIKTETKRAHIEEVWEWSGAPLPQSSALSDGALWGIGGASRYASRLWIELDFLLTLMVAWKELPLAEQLALAENREPWPFCRWVTQQSGSSNPSFRHMLLYFCFPQKFERICSGAHKKKIYWAFRDQLAEGEDPYRKTQTSCALDQAIFAIREKLADEFGRDDLDFYNPPLREMWGDGAKDEESTEIDMDANAEQFYQSYRDRGFFFSSTVLTRYALALHCKPFVILSGVSGTGKTKIAQLFEPPTSADTATSTSRGGEAASRIVFTVTRGMRTGDGRGNLPAEQKETVFEQSELEKIDERSPMLLEAGVDDNVIDPVQITVETPGGEELTFGLYYQRPKSPLIRLRARSKRGESPEYDSRPYLQEQYAVDDVVELEKIAPYRFRIIPKDEASQPDLRELAKADQLAAVSDNRNKLFLSVESNWTDRTELFGFYNQIEGRYNSTPLLKFLQQAAENPNAPHFLILDEMNLSKVEHYFSDFLSCLESRIRDGNQVRQEPIRLHGRGDFVEADDPVVEQVPAELYLPANLYVTGTVNVDETTYMFSPKVLDRANVIEFNHVDLGLLDEDEAADDKTLVLESMPSFESTTPVTVEDYRAAPESVKEMLSDLIKALEPYSMHFGYRVVQEICRFINAARDYVRDDQDTINAALDAQIVQKVLPKFSGSQAQLEEPLRKILALLLRDADEFAGIVAEQISPAWLEDNSAAVAASSYPLSVDKLHRMLTDLNIRGFTNFIG